MSELKTGRRVIALLAAALLATALQASVGPSIASAEDPFFVFTPEPVPPPPGQPPPDPKPPPNGYLNGPCGLAVDSSENLYVSDHYHSTVNVFDSSFVYGTQLEDPVPPGRPCDLAIDSSDNVYVNSFHRGVVRFGPQPGFADPEQIDPGPATGVAVDRSDDTVYVNRRDHIAVYDSDGDPVRDGGGQPVRIGDGSLSDAYGLAVSAYFDTAGYLYVPDAGDQSVKVFDPDAVNVDDPVQVIDGSDTPAGSFSSLVESSVAVDRARGHLYVIDVLDPAEETEQPEAMVHVFSSDRSRLGHLKFKVVHGEPTGLAVDNSATGTQGRVYVTSGNTHQSGIYAYRPGSAVSGTPEGPTTPPEPLGGDQPSATIPVGGPAGQGSGILCEGDACQHLPSDPTDPTLTTLLEGLGNPPVHYIRAPQDCRPYVAAARSLHRKARRGAIAARRFLGRGSRAKAQKLRRQAVKLKQRSRAYFRAARRCVQANRSGEAGASSSGSGVAFSAGAGAATDSGGSLDQSGGDGSTAAGGTSPGAHVGAASAGATALSDPIPEGFAVAAIADGGGAATEAGSRPYALELSMSAPETGDLRTLGFNLPTGFLVNPAAVPNCSADVFATDRVSPLGEYESGENCSGRSQVGTIQVETGAGETRTFGLFNLTPADGSAFRFGAAPFGEPVVFEAEVRSGGEGAFGVRLAASDIPQGLAASGLSVSLWGIPWDASHNTLRGDCLNEQEPSFGLSKCWTGEPLSNRPLALLTLPTECSGALAFAARVRTWQGDAGTATEVNRTSGGAPAPMADCSSLSFQSLDLRAEGLLGTAKASSPTGFVFRLQNDLNLGDPRSRLRSLVKDAVVELPDGVTLNPSLGAGLEVCTPTELARETPFNPPGAGCPNGSKIGDFRVRLPYFEGFLDGGIYLAEPDDPDTSRSGAENPFDSLVAIYLVAKSTERGLMIRVPGELRPDPGDGTITAIFEGLPQLPYTDLEANFRAGQRSALISPPSCGATTTDSTLTPSAQGVDPAEYATNTEITSGVGAGPCPSGEPPFEPGVRAGGVNSNVGSYTPYFVRLSRDDTDKQITSYSLDLPRGITAKLAGIPFCSEAAIRRARSRSGFDEQRDSSCPEASRVGRTLTGYGVGGALTYAPGRIYLAGPYQGQPLSLVTVNAATVGPFDLGTIVIRSAFSLNPRTAKLEIEEGSSDPIPHILDGIPLHLREIRITMDRKNFTRNPTSCQASRMISELTGSGAAMGDPSTSRATVSEHFQLLNCLELGFRPQLGLDLRGGVRRSAHPSLRATFQARGPQDANLKDMTVTMPSSLFLAQDHIRGICTRPQFAREACPADSIYGFARGVTPLFDEPLTGPVYLRSSDNPLPDLVASLRSGSIRIILEGRIGPSESGGIRTSFNNLPDAPLTSFTMRLLGGSRGLIVNSQNICEAPPQANVRALGQNNRGAVFSTRLRGNCGRYLLQKRKRERLAKLKARRQAKQRARQQSIQQARRATRS